MNLHEISRGEQPADRIPVAAVGADERRQRDDAGLREEIGHGADPPDVLFAVGRAKTEAKPFRELPAVPLFQERRRGGEAMADIVSVKHKGAASPLVKLAVYAVGQRALATA